MYLKNTENTPDVATIRVEMSNLVVDSLTRKYKQVRKGLGEIMGGVVLETLSTKAWNEGIEIGTAKGREEGRDKHARETALAMLADGIDITKIAKYSGLSIEAIEAIAEEMSANS